MVKVERLEDMSLRGRLRLLEQDNGDIIVAVQAEENGLLQPGGSVEFCMPGPGGGRSPRTLVALRALLGAMAEDNAADTSRAPQAEVREASRIAGEEYRAEAAISTDELCPDCHGECGLEVAASSSNYFWRECMVCEGTGKAKR